MATILQLRRGTTVQHSTFTGAVGEVTVDTTKDTVVVHDGTTAGGKPLATEAYVTSQIQTKDNSDEITEGSTNLYFTNTRARGAFTASTGISITDGAISTSITQYTDALARAAISVTDTGGDGSLSYNNTTGVLTYTGPSASDVRAHFSAGTGVTITNGQVAIGQAVGTGSNVTFNDLTVSGNLTVSGTTTTVNTETINLADNIITLNSNEAGTPSQNAGIEVERGTSTNVAFQWNETTDVWEYTVDGTNYIPVVGTTATQTLTNKTLTSPTLTTPTLGVASATSVNKVAITAPATGSTLTIADGKTLTASNTLTFTGTDASSVAFGAGGTVAYTANKLSAFAATTSSELLGVISDETGTGALVFANTPTLVTPNIGAATGTSLTTTGGGVLSRAAATQDGIELRGRAGGTGNWEAILTPTTLSADRTFTFPDVSGTVITTGDTGSVTNTMLAGSIANAKLANSAITLAGTSVSLGGAFTATNMLDAIKTVDGAGSGLDADLLDGNSSAYFRINVYNAAGTLLN